MCQTCRSIIAKLNPDFSEAMKLHGAELIEILRKINLISNKEATEELIANVKKEGVEAELPLFEKFAALEFAPYVIGFLSGHIVYSKQSTVNHIQLFVSGHQFGHAGSSTGHDVSALLGLVEPDLTH